MLWFWLFILLVILLVALLPAWPYARARGWGYAPSGCLLALIVPSLADHAPAIVELGLTAVAAIAGIAAIVRREGAGR